MKQNIFLLLTCIFLFAGNTSFLIDKIESKTNSKKVAGPPWYADNQSATNTLVKKVTIADASCYYSQPIFLQAGESMYLTTMCNFGGANVSILILGEFDHVNLEDCNGGVLASQSFHGTDDAWYYFYDVPSSSCYDIVVY